MIESEVRRKVFLIDENSLEHKLLKAALVENGYELSSSSDVNFNPTSLKCSPPDLILVECRDNGLPELQQSLYWMRTFCSVPIVAMVTPEQIHLIQGGAIKIDHYLAKPFTIEELGAYVNTLPPQKASCTSCAPTQWPYIERRSSATPNHREPAPPLKDHQAELNPFHIDDESREVFFHGQALNLSPKEFALFRMLYAKSGGLITEKEITDTLWPRASGITDADIRQYIYRLRRKIAKIDESGAEGIQTIKGRGYRMMQNPGAQKSRQAPELANAGHGSQLLEM